MIDRITHDPKVLGGRATIRGRRISVAHVVNLVANGMTPQEIVADLPDLELEDVRQALAYAATLLAAGVLDRPSVVLFRLADERAESVNRRLVEVIREHSETLEAGALVLVEDARVRVRRLPIQS